MKIKWNHFIYNDLSFFNPSNKLIPIVVKLFWFNDLQYKLYI